MTNEINKKELHRQTLNSLQRAAGQVNIAIAEMDSALREIAVIRYLTLEAYRRNGGDLNGSNPNGGSAV